MSLTPISAKLATVNNTTKLGHRHGKHLADKRTALLNDLLNECGGGTAATDKYSHDAFQDAEDKFQQHQAELKIVRG